MSIDQCCLIQLNKIDDERGSLVSIQAFEKINFKISRIYYLFDLKSGSSRGSHAHRNLHQLLIAASGSFDIDISDGFSSKKITLNRAYEGLYICPMIWRELSNFSSGSICLVLASEFYDENDYIRDKTTFIKMAREKK